MDAKYEKFLFVRKCCCICKSPQFTEYDGKYLCAKHLEEVKNVDNKRTGGVSDRSPRRERFSKDTSSGHRRCCDDKRTATTNDQGTG